MCVASCRCLVYAFFSCLSTAYRDSLYTTERTLYNTNNNKDIARHHQQQQIIPNIKIILKRRDIPLENSLCRITHTHKIGHYINLIVVGAMSIREQTKINRNKKLLRDEKHQIT